MALKVLPLAGLLDSRALARFRNEAQVAGRLHHSHIVPIYSVGCERGVHYYAMQYIDGVSLDRLLAQPTDALTDTHPMAILSTAEPNDDSNYLRVAELIAQAADALEYAHQRNVVHRDIKPANLLLDQQGQIWIADFGVARVVGASELTATGDVPGTLRYMSPEQASGHSEQIDHRTDVYSLGTTLYELLTRHPVFGRGHREDILWQVANVDPIPPSQHSPRIPADLETIVLKALAKAPADRFATAADLAADLRRFCDGRPILARRATWIQRGLKWGRRNRSLVRALGASAILLLIIAAAAAWQISYERLYRQHQEDLARTRQELVNQHTYVTRIVSAAHSLHGNRIQEFEHRLLESEPRAGEPDVRGFEWRYLWEMSRKIPPSFAQHDGEAYCARFSPDGHWLATSGSDGVRIWEWPSRFQVRHLREAREDVNGVAWSPDGGLLASFSDDMHLRIYRTNTWSLDREIPLTGKLVGGEFSPNSERLVVAERDGVRTDLDRDGNRVHLLDTLTWQSLRVFTEPGSTLQGVAVSGDGRLAVVTSVDGAFAFDLVNMQFKERLNLQFKEGTKDYCTAVAFTRTGSLLAISAAERIVVLDAEDGRIVAKLEGKNVAEGLAFSRDDRSLVSAHRGNEMCVWEATPSGAWKLVTRYVFSNPLWSVAVHDDGSLVTTDRAGGVGLRSQFHLPDRQRLSTSPDVIHDWLSDPQAPNEPFPRYCNRVSVQNESNYPASAFAWSVDGASLLLAETATNLTAWNIRQCEPIGQRTVGTSHVSAVARSPDGRLDAVATVDGKIRLLERPRSEVRSTANLPRCSIAMCFSADSQTLYLLSLDRRLVAVDVDTMRDLTNRIPAEWSGVAYLTPASGEDLSFVLANMDVRAMRHVLNILRTGGVYAVSRDFRVVAKHIGDYDRVHVWEAPDGNERTVITGLGKGLVTLALSSDGATLATLFNDGHVSLWHTRTGRSLLSLDPHLQQAHKLTFSPDGRFLLCLGESYRGGGEMVVWEAP